MVNLDPSYLERMVVHSVILYPESLEELLESVPLKYFTPLHQRVLERVLECQNEGLEVSYARLLERLGARACQSEDFVAILATQPQPGYLGLLEELKHALRLKVQAQLASQMNQANLKGEIFNADFLAQYIELEDNDQDTKTFAEWAEYFKNQPPIAKISSGIPFIDQATGGGFREKSFILIGGDPDAGKTTLGLQILNFMSLSHKVHYFSYEVPLDGLVERMQGVEALRSGYFAQDTLHMRQSKRALDDVVGEIRRQAKRGVKAFLIDSQMCIETPLGRRPEEEETRKFSQLAALAHSQQFNIIIFLLVQSSKAESITPFNSKLGAYYADIMIHIHGDKKSDIREVDFPKNKQGGYARAFFKVDRARFCFTPHEPKSSKKQLEALGLD
ncbi:ATPase domain-containing protein [Helicobacter vulpis]|uniref:ATPase domain-containing protein n=1 Tax=Helicobacter vulpis TaxID=2316076 RepID=UPI000EAD9042|nr:ATPase domain-containing protein [Helicobacter vulpis]